MKVVGVRFEPSGRVYYLDPGDLDLQQGDRVLTDVEAEIREADVVIAPGQVIYSEVRSRSGLVLGRVEES